MQKEWKTETGQLWEIVGKAGTHRVLCGDSTKAAAEQLGRVCYGMEIEPKYIAVILQRMKDMGLEPNLTT